MSNWNLMTINATLPLLVDPATFILSVIVAGSTSNPPRLMMIYHAHPLVHRVTSETPLSHCRFFRPIMMVNIVTVNMAREGWWTLPDNDVEIFNGHYDTGKWSGDNAWLSNIYLKQGDGEWQLSYVYTMVTVNSAVLWSGDREYPFALPLDAWWIVLFPCMAMVRVISMVMVNCQAWWHGQSLSL